MINDLPFNPSPSSILHLDLNSCFAAIEQQANHFLRGKPIAVVAYTTPNACIIAPSVEAKKFGLKVGMRVREGKMLCPRLIILPPDPWKYRFINRKLLALLRAYSADLQVKSIDEMVLNFAQTKYFPDKLTAVAQEIKERIRKEIGEWMTVSIGIAPNRFLAKTAASLHKPDGLDEINPKNVLKIYTQFRVEQLCGIKINNMIRLNRVGIFTVLEMYHASVQKLKSAFQSILGYYWYLRLRGYEVDAVEWQRKSFGQSYALYKATRDETFLAKILCKLVEKMGRRLRTAGYSARGIHLSCEYSNHTIFRKGVTLSQIMYASSDLYKEALRLLLASPLKPVRNLAVACFHLEKNQLSQLSLLPEENKKRALTLALDEVSEKYGNFTVFPATMIGTEDKVPDRIAFGGIKEIEEFI